MIVEDPGGRETKAATAESGGGSDVPASKWVEPELRRGEPAELSPRGALTAFGLNLPGWLRARAHAADLRGRGGQDVSCILLWLQGGLSHIDSFDPKPDAPVEIRGEFGVIDTNVPASGSATGCRCWRSIRTSIRSYAR